MTNEIEIGPADSGYKEIHLRCLEKKRFFQVLRMAKICKN